MTVKFKAVVIDNQNEKFTRDIKEIDTSHLKNGNVLIKIDFSSLKSGIPYLSSPPTFSSLSKTSTV